MRRLVVLLFTVSLAFLLVACGDANNNENVEVNISNQNNESSEVVDLGAVEISDDERAADDEVVAKVNGTDILGEQYNVVYFQVKRRISREGEDVEDLDQIKEITLNSLVEQEVVIQSQDEELDITIEDAEKIFEEINTETNGELETTLETYDITEEAYKQWVLQSLIAEEHVYNISETLEVSDDEIAQAYDELKANNDELPELEEISGELEAILIGEKVEEKIEALKEEATIEELI